MKTIELTQAFIDANDAILENWDALSQTHALRTLIKVCEERITEISDDAVRQATGILNLEDKSQGAFEFGGKRYQLQVTETYDFSNYNRYKDEDAVRWRALKKEQDALKKQSSALTKQMKGIADAFVTTHPDWESDRVTVVLKCL